jgi:uncharacterized metal-binding protein YceD (DUF177 family)
MTAKDAQTPHRLRVASLRQTGETPFLIEPDAQTRADLAVSLGAEALRKLRFEGELSPRGKEGWDLTARLGVTAVQPCIVTLEPVTTRIDTEVVRRFVPAHLLDAIDAGSEMEMPEDDTVEPLGDVIDLDAIMNESIALALPAYPRKDGAALEDAQFAEDGVTPMTDEDVKPFAGLAALREKMQGGDGDA